MPHINSLRLVNVHYNNATQFYDDFRLELGGKNATYDLENGGGKSLLLLMLLQTVLPKSFLRKEKPVSLLFQGGKERTSHVAVEWILEEGSQYKYLLTGFSARRKRGRIDSSAPEAGDEEENLMSGDIEHINWCVFFNDNKSVGIKTAPLCKDEGGKRYYSSFDEIRKYVQHMRHKGLPAEVFDGIDKYQSFISAHQLIPAEWNIIRGINSGENNIESYFRQNPTSRKLIENQFVKIIEDVEDLNKGKRDSKESLLLADALIEIRSRLNDYMRLKGHMREFEKIKEYYREFGIKNKELLGIFTEYESLKSRACGIRNLIEVRIKQLEEKNREALKNQELNKSGLQESITLGRLLEAGRVQHEIRKLEAELEELKREEEKLLEEKNELEANFDELMTLESYGQYKRLKRRQHEAKTSLSAFDKDKGELTREYRNAGGKLRYLLGKEVEKGCKEEEELKAALEKIDRQRNEIQGRLIEVEKRESVLEAQISQLHKREKETDAKIGELQSLFMENGEIEAVLDPKKILAKTQEHIATSENSREQAADRIKDIDNKTHELELKAAEIEGDIKLKDSEKQADEETIRGYNEELSELKARAAAFGKDTVEAYGEELELLIQRESLAKLEREIELARMKQKKELSQKRNCYVPNEELLSFAELLSDRCEFVKTGIDWIAEADKDLRKSILEELPFIPFSVIVDGKSFDRIRRGKIKLKFNSDYLVPIVNLDTVREMMDPSKEGIFYQCSFEELLLDEEQFVLYIEGVNKRLEGFEQEIEASGKRIESLKADMNRLAGFWARYSKESIDGLVERVRERDKEIKEMQSRLCQAEKEKLQLSDEKTTLLEQMAKLDVLLKKAAEKAERLQGLISSRDELAEIKGELSPKRIAHGEVVAEIKNAKEAAERAEKKYGKTQQSLSRFSNELQDLKGELGHLESYEEVCSSETLDNVRAEYKTLYDIAEGRIDGERRLREDIDEYIEGMNDLENRISRDYGKSLESLWESENSGLKIVIPTQALIVSAKADKEAAVEKLGNHKVKINKMENRISKSEGKQLEILKEVPEDKRSELPSYENENRYDEEIENARLLVKLYEEELEKLAAELDGIKSEAEKLKMQAEQYRFFIEREEAEDDGSLAAEIEDFNMFSQAYANLNRNLQKQCENWDKRIREIQQETSEYVIREPIEELSKIGKPEAAWQCENRLKAFDEYVMNIEEQMEKISNDILQLESYQQDFMRRCIQRAELVLGHLRKLEALSRIDVYGRRTNMVELKIQEFDDKEKQFRMKNHIDGIVKEINEEGVVDRARISARLSTKELLAQITDMDKATVRLYKIESIPENSRFYRWEQAIGSEGQNNSWYFIFAACLISFIRMLSITNTSLKNKKVIIADNPFGSTSAIYLWDPMFKIMKQNDIQLIAPGHRIPREITSRFGVSYLLNQDILQDGRTKVVVKDVRVEEDEDVMRYVDTEQMSLF